MTIHGTAARGFERGAGDYERGRPGYPDEVRKLLTDELGVGPGVRVADVGAGTGKFTRVLAATGADVVAFEPVASMRVVFRRSLPDVEISEGTAEQIPLADGSLDLLAAAQAFHWFEADAALSEAHRVLKPGGVLFLVWNKRDIEVDWVQRVERLHTDLAGDAPRYTRDLVKWTTVIHDHGGFTEVEHRTFPNEVDIDVPTLRAREASVSYIAALPEMRRGEVLDEVESIVRTGPLSGGGERFTERYLTDVYWCRKR